jgi:hypothetical protein
MSASETIDPVLDGDADVQITTGRTRSCGRRSEVLRDITPVSGGATQVLHRGDVDYIDQIATDGSCVYWSSVNPPRILVRSAPR